MVWMRRPDAGGADPGRRVSASSWARLAGLAWLRLASGLTVGDRWAGGGRGPGPPLASQPDGRRVWRVAHGPDYRERLRGAPHPGPNNRNRRFFFLRAGSPEHAPPRAAPKPLPAWPVAESRL